MSSCGCCLVENGHNIILEIVTATIAFCFLILDIWLTPTAFHMLLCDVGPIVASGIGIAALKCQRNFRLARVTVHAATMAVGMYCAMAVLFIIALHEVYTNPNHDMFDHIDMAINFAYLLFGFVTCIALATKHWQIYRNNLRNALTTVNEMMLVQYQPSVPKDQQFHIEYHYANPAMHLQQHMGNVYINPQESLMLADTDQLKPPIYDSDYALPPTQPPPPANCSYVPAEEPETNDPPPPYAKFALDTV